MACTNDDYERWLAIPAGSVYELSVSGPASAYAMFEAAGQSVVNWLDVSPGPHREVLTGAGVHAVFIFVTVLAAGTAVEVKAQITTPSGAVFKQTYCHSVQRPAGSVKAVVHDLGML